MHGRSGSASWSASTALTASVVGAAFADPARAPFIPEAGLKFWEKLRTERRVQQRPHVTLVHSKALASRSRSDGDADGDADREKEKGVWEGCRALHALPHPPLLSLLIVSDDRCSFCTLCCID